MWCVACVYARVHMFVRVPLRERNVLVCVVRMCTCMYACMRASVCAQLSFKHTHMFLLPVAGFLQNKPGTSEHFEAAFLFITVN